MNAAFETLLSAYRDRDQAWRSVRAPGQAVIGHVGNTVPVEAITASGALAWRVAPVEGDPGRADAWIESYSDTDMRLIFANTLAGAYDGMDLLVIPRSSETQHKLYLALREARHVGLHGSGPALWLYDILHTQRETSRRYGVARTRELLDRLPRVPDDDALAAAVDQADATRRLLAKLQDGRRQGRVRGWQAQIASGALFFMTPAAGHAALSDWLSGPLEAPPDGPRLLVKGVPLDHDRLHALVETLGATIVAEDDDWGTRAAEAPIGSGRPPLDAIFEHYWRDVPCPRIHPMPADGGWFARRLAEGGIDGVLFNLPRPDDIHGWTFPAERAIAERAGVPWLQLRDDARSAPDALAEALRTFIDSLRR